MSSELTDKELLSRALRLRDPYEQPGLIPEVPPGVGLIDVLNTYAFERFPDEKVWCAGCKAHRHGKGFTALLSNGERALFGSRCGSRAFGESWSEATKRMDALRDRQYEIERSLRAKVTLPDLQRALWRWDRPVSKLAARMAQFESRLGDVHAGLAASAITDDSILSVDERVRDLAAEHRDSTGTQPRFTVRKHTLGRFRGADVVRIGYPQRDLKRVTEDLATYLKIVQGVTDIIPTTRLRRCRLAVERGVDGLESVFSLYQSATEFFQPENLRLIKRWAEMANRKMPAQIRGSVLVLDNGGEIGMRGVEALDRAPFELLAEFRRAD